MQHILEAMGADTPLGLVIVGGDGVIRHLNGRMLKWIGTDGPAWLNQPFRSLFSRAKETGPACRQASATVDGTPYRPVSRGDDPMMVERARINFGGRQLICLLCFPFKDGDGLPSHALLFHDADEAGGLRLGFTRAVKRFEEALLERNRLLAKLDQANVHLLRAEKMAGIGQLAAGVAHEINNPIGYVFSNLKTLAGYMHDMLKIIDAADSVSSIDELRILKRSLDYDYIRGDVEALIDESEEGIDRVKKIITALKDFSHMDEEGFRQADLQQAIETTLSIANNELKYKAKLVKCYGALPMVECSISQLNQVIMNLVMNAAQALSDFGTITIRTGHENEWVWLEIEDTGEGMEESVKDRIFEPFFTTKPLGQGTGLGLSLSYSIVQKHHGHIDVTSEPGKGSCFRVWLPVEHAGLRQV